MASKVLVSEEDRLSAEIFSIILLPCLLGFCYLRNELILPGMEFEETSLL
jgi:hypothetical protein